MNVWWWLLWWFVFLVFLFFTGALIVGSIQEIQKAKKGSPMRTELSHAWRRGFAAGSKFQADVKRGNVGIIDVPADPYDDGARRS